MTFQIFLNETHQNSSIENITANSPTNWKAVFLWVVLILIITVTFFGNCLVLLAVKQDKHLRTPFNYYIVNLAITDVTVALTAMSFYGIDNIMGYWPFGEFLCGVWIFSDYGLTFASLFTLLAISIDRFWGVTWSIHYRRHHNKKICICVIAVIWLLTIGVWLPATVIDRLNNAIPGTCLWKPSLNPEYVYVVAILGYHGPCAVIIGCYLRIVIQMRRKSNDYRTRKKAPLQRKQQNISGENKESQITNATGSGHLRRINRNYGSSNEEACTTHGQLKRERQIFVTLTYILCGYLACWLPFHVVFDVMAIDPAYVPRPVLMWTYWMAYINSTINPILYNFSSPEFRRAFMKILCTTSKVNSMETAKNITHSSSSAIDLCQRKIRNKENEQ
ncbi:hypothetical protein ScPMuIL_016868 [Solemya velum]